MFNFNIGEVPKPISDLLMVNRLFHNHNTRRVGYLYTPLGRSEASYGSFSYFGTHIWSHISQNVLINVSYSKFNFLNKFYILNNEIPMIRLDTIDVIFPYAIIHYSFITIGCFHLLKLYEHCTMHYSICIDIFFSTILSF